MTHDYPESLLHKISLRNAKHVAQLRESITDLGDWYKHKAVSFFEKYSAHLHNEKKAPDFGVDCYLKMVEHMRDERMDFIRSGKYSNSSFEEVDKQVYSNPELMDVHMHGLVLAQFLWYDQFQRFAFFSENLYKYTSEAGSYLEIGGGHGLYINEALELLPHVNRFDLVDISETSIKLAQGILDSDRVNYFHKNIFDYDEGEHRYDFITIGEVLEHLESPAAMLNKISGLLSDNGVCYVTTPVNAPMIDHIYLFNSTDEIRQLFEECGLQILEETIAVSDNKPAEYAAKNKTPVMYAAFVTNK